MRKIALAGNPNSGKSTLFNALTGGTAFVGNWPGVTVEKKEGKMTIAGEKVTVMDLPGIYSLSPYSNEEIISRDYIINEKPEVIINIVDASNLERNLYLTTQLIELGTPVVVALNMMDVVKSKGEELSLETLSKELGCPVVGISAINKTGLPELKEVVKSVLDGRKMEANSFSYSDDVQKSIEVIKEAAVAANMPASSSNDYYALKMLANDEKIVASINVPAPVMEAANAQRSALEAKYDDEIDSIIAEQRYAWIKTIIDSVIVVRRKKELTLSDKIDKVLTNKWLALPLFFFIIYCIYYVCLNPNGLGKKLVGITFTWVINAMIWTATTLTEMGVSPWLVSLCSDGIVFGVGIVAAFIPYLMILFIFLAILEECGYMARVSFIFDRVFRRFGLSGKSFVPILLGTGCTVQAVASTRTIEDENDRKMTIFLLGFMPCATMMPTVILAIGVFSTSALVAPLVYLISFLFIILGGIFLKRTFLKGKPAPFVMELPEYKLPRIKNVFHFVWEKTVSLFRKLTSIVVFTTIIVWFLKYFNFSFQPVESIDQSMLASIGRALEPIFVPLGLGQWQLISAMITGYVAKDNMLGTLGVIFGAEITSGVLATMLTPAATVSFLLFFILSCPCFSTMGAMRKELGNGKLTWQAIGFQMGTAYVVAFIAYQILRFII